MNCTLILRILPSIAPENMRPLLTCVIFAATLCPATVFSGPPENIKFGIYGRSEQNIYRYYDGKSKGNFYTQRVSSGYSTGIMAHSSINYLFNAGLGFGMAEASYAPNMLLNGNTIWTVNLRLWQLNFWGELKLGKDEDKGTRIFLGGEFMFQEYKREIWANGLTGYPSWPRNRFMPRLGVSYEYPIQKKWTIQPNVGLRLAFYNQVGYDYVWNQFFAGVNVAYRLKSW
jgi:hypothetical protein